MFKFQEFKAILGYISVSLLKQGQVKGQQLNVTRLWTNCFNQTVGFDRV